MGIHGTSARRTEDAGAVEMIPVPALFLRVDESVWSLSPAITLELSSTCSLYHPLFDIAPPPPNVVLLAVRGACADHRKSGRVAHVIGSTSRTDRSREILLLTSPTCAPSPSQLPPSTQRLRNGSSRL